VVTARVVEVVAEVVVEVAPVSGSRVTSPSTQISAESTRGSQLRILEKTISHHDHTTGRGGSWERKKTWEVSP
jgi:hypothetical protein